MRPIPSSSSPRPSPAPTTWGASPACSTSGPSPAGSTRWCGPSRECCPARRSTPAQDFSQRIQSGLDVQAATLLAVAAAAAIAGIGVAAQAVVRVVRGSRADDAVRAVLGMTRSQRAASAALCVLPAALGAAALSVVGGVLLGPVAITGLAELAEPDPGVWIDWPVALLVAGCAFGLVLIVAVAAPTAATLWRPRAVERPVRHEPTTFLSPTTSLGVRRALGGGLTRWAGRSALVAAVLAVAAVAAVTTFARSVDALLTEPDRWAADFDAVGLVGAEPDAVERIATALEDDPRVEAVAEGRRIEAVVSRPGGTARLFEAVSSRSELGSIRPWVQTSGVAPRSPREVLVGQLRARADRHGGGRPVADAGRRPHPRRAGRRRGDRLRDRPDGRGGRSWIPSLTDALAEGLEDRYVLLRFAPGVDVDAGGHRAVEGARARARGRGAPVHRRPAPGDRLAPVRARPASSLRSGCSRWPRARHERAAHPARARHAPRPRDDPPPGRADRAGPGAHDRRRRRAASACRWVSPSAGRCSSCVDRGIGALGAPVRLDRPASASPCSARSWSRSSWPAWPCSASARSAGPPRCAASDPTPIRFSLGRWPATARRRPAGGGGRRRRPRWWSASWGARPTRGRGDPCSTRSAGRRRGSCGRRP